MRTLKDGIKDGKYGIQERKAELSVEKIQCKNGKDGI